MIAGRIKGSVIERNVRRRPAPRSNRRLLQRDVDLLEPGHQHEDSVRSVITMVADDHGQDRARDPERVEEEEQGDLKTM